MTDGGATPRQEKQANSRERYCSLIQTSPQSLPSESLRRRRWKRLSQLLQAAEFDASAGSPHWAQATFAVSLSVCI